MKKIVFSLIVALTVCTQLSAQDITGPWKGKVSFQGTEITLVFNIIEQGDNISATMDSPAQGAFGIPTDVSTFVDNVLTIEHKQSGFKYIGNFKDETFEGTLYQGGMEFPMILTKVIPKDPNNLVGSWKGTMLAQGQEIPLVFNISKSESGYATTMDSPLQGAKDVPTDATIFKDNRVTIEVKAAGFKYEGALTDGKIDGKIYQAGMEFPLVLEKANAADIANTNAAVEQAGNFQKEMQERMTTELEDRVYTKEEVASDVDFYIKTLEEVCPYPYVNTSKEKIYTIAKKIKSKPARSGKAVYLDFLELSAAYNTGHIYILPAQNLMQNHLSNGGKIFPFALKRNGNQYRVEIVANKDFEAYKNAIIYSINGVKTEKLLANYKKYINEDKDLNEVARQIGSYLYFNDIKAPYTIEYALEHSEKKQKTTILGVNAIEKEQKSEILDNQDQLSSFITFKMLDKNVAYLNVKSMALFNENLKQEYFDFVKTTFAEIEKNESRHLIIDLRENGGGHGHFAEELLGYFADKPFRQSAGEVRRVSTQFQDIVQMMPAQQRSNLPQKDGVGYLELAPGTDIESFVEPQPLKEVAHKFKGKVWCLIGNRTFSAAMMMANAIEDYNLATLVGEPTGGVPNELSDVIPVKMPNTKISFSAPSVMFTRASGDASNPNPVQPNVLINKTKGDKDEALDYILKEIKN